MITSDGVVVEIKFLINVELRRVWGCGDIAAAFADVMDVGDLVSSAMGAPSSSLCPALGV